MRKPYEDTAKNQTEIFRKEDQGKSKQAFHTGGDLQTEINSTLDGISLENEFSLLEKKVYLKSGKVSK